MADQAAARLTTVAMFPTHSFPENLLIRSDNSILLTRFNHNELWYLPPVDSDVPVLPLLLFTFDPPPMSIVEPEPNIYYVCTSNFFTTHEACLFRPDLRDWRPGLPVQPAAVLQFPVETARAINGSCLLAPKVILFADSFAKLIWRVDLPEPGQVAKLRPWLEHDSMAHLPESATPDQPGVNGVKFAASTSHLYYTSTAKQLFLRVKVDPATLDPAGEPELLATGIMGDDFWIDEEAGHAYVATHRQNGIDRVSLEPGPNNSGRVSIVGDPFTDEVIGTTSGGWGRKPGEYGRVAYFMADGGNKSPPPDGIVRPAKVIRLEL